MTDGAGDGVGVPVIVPPLPASIPYSRIPTKIATVTTTNPFDHGSRTRRDGSSVGAVLTDVAAAADFVALPVGAAATGSTSGSGSGSGSDPARTRAPAPAQARARAPRQVPGPPRDGLGLRLRLRLRLGLGLLPRDFRLRCGFRLGLRRHGLGLGGRVDLGGRLGRPPASRPGRPRVDQSSGVVTPRVRLKARPRARGRQCTQTLQQARPSCVADRRDEEARQAGDHRHETERRDHGRDRHDLGQQATDSPSRSPWTRRRARTGSRPRDPSARPECVAGRGSGWGSRRSCW